MSVFVAGCWMQCQSQKKRGSCLSYSRSWLVGWLNCIKHPKGQMPRGARRNVRKPQLSFNQDWDICRSIMLRSHRTRCEYSLRSKGSSFTAAVSCVYSHHSNKTRWPGGYNYNKMNIFYRDWIVIDVSKWCRSNNILIPVSKNHELMLWQVCRQTAGEKPFKMLVFWMKIGSIRLN